MWYRAKINKDRFFVDEATLADMKADGKKFEVETTNKCRILVGKTQTIRHSSVQ